LTLDDARESHDIIEEEGKPVKRERMYLAFRLSVAVATALTVHAEASAQQLFWIAPLSGGDQSIAYDISDDGQVVVGTYQDPVNRKTHAFV
jgi:hypothetical protein